MIDESETREVDGNKETVRYVLATPFTYDHGGERRENGASFLELTAPSSRHSHECAFLKQAFFRAIGERRDEGGEEDETQGNPTGHEVMIAIAMSTTVELSKVIEVGRKLLTSGTALVDGEEKLTKPLADRMTQDDLEGAIGEYLVCFILASALARMKKRSSAGS